MYKALVSFSGVINMAMGEVREISDPALVADLSAAGYIEPVKGKSAPAAEEPVVKKGKATPKK